MHLAPDEEESISISVSENEFFFLADHAAAVDAEDDPLVGVRHREAAPAGDIRPPSHGEDDIIRWAIDFAHDR